MTHRVYPFTDPDNYVFDHDRIEVVEGKARPVGSWIYLSFSTDLVADWAEENDSPLDIVGGAAVVSSKLSLINSDLRYVVYSAEGNANIANFGAIRFLITPNYNGSPIGALGEQHFISVNDGNGADIANEIDLFQRVNGQITLLVKDKDADDIISNVDIGSWSPTSGVEYEFELNVDTKNGVTNLFIDGVQLGSTIISKGIREGTMHHFHVGTNIAKTALSNFAIADLQIFKSARHILDYTPSSAPATRYVINDNPSFHPADTVPAEALIDWVETVEKFGLDDVRYNPFINGIPLWWNGSIWVVSNNTYTQTNTAAEIVANKATLIPPLFEGNFTAHIFLHSEDGTSAGLLDEVEIDYDFWSGNVVFPIQCNIYGLLLGPDNLPIIGAKITAVSTQRNLFPEVQIGRKALVTTITDDAGYWELTLTNTESLGNTAIGYSFIFEHPDLYYPLPDKKQVPEQVSAAYDTLQNVV